MTNEPKLKVEFHLDEKGEPVKFKHGGLTHYEVKISIEDAPDGTYGVTYRLHPTFFDPVREVLNDEGDFAEEITTYGNFQVAAKIRTETGSRTVRDTIAEALERSYAGAQSGPIVDALTTIKKY